MLAVNAACSVSIAFKPLVHNAFPQTGQIANSFIPATNTSTLFTFLDKVPGTSLAIPLS